MVTQMQAQTREREGKEQIMVVTQGENGFRVYAASNPSKVFDVTGNPEAPDCNCPEFQWRRDKQGYRCAHIEAVFRECRGNLSATERALNERGIGCTRRWLGIFSNNGV